MFVNKYESVIRVLRIRILLVGFIRIRLEGS